MYAERNFKRKKQFIEAVKAGEKIRLFNPGIQFGPEQKNGEVSVEGPHYPEPHKWYARVTLVDGIVTSVK